MEIQKFARLFVIFLLFSGSLAGTAGFCKFWLAGGGKAFISDGRPIISLNSAFTGL